MRNIAFSLAFNLVSEAEKTMKRIYTQNDKEYFTHTLIDLGFPLLEGDKIPDDIESAKRLNTDALKELADRCGSEYLQLPNVGVQPNHTAFYKHIKVADTDVLVSADLDEVTLTDNWIRSMCRVCRNSNIALASLMQIDVEPQMKPEWYDEVFVEGERVWIMKGLLNWAQIAFKGEFLNKIDCALPFPEEAKVYGFIEGLAKQFFPLGYNWCILPDSKVEHTDLVPLYREWKDYIVLQNAHLPQIHFEQWLEFKRDGTL